MRLRRLLLLFYLLNRGTRRRLVAANVGLIVGVTLVTLFITSGFGLRELVLNGFLGALPLDQVKVVPRSMDIAFLRLGRPKILGGGKLDRSVVEKLTADEAVRALYPIAYARFPIHLHGELLGSHYGTDAPVQGIDPRWVADEVSEGHAFVFEEGEPIPVLVSRKALQIYNAGFAPANNLPRLSEAAIIGREIEIELGSSTLVGRGDRSVSSRARIVGFSDRVDPLAVAVPMSMLDFYDERLLGTKREEWDAAIIEAQTVGDMARIESAARRLGLEIAPESHLARQIDGAIKVTIAVFSAVGGVIIALSLMNAANTLILILRERRYELGVVRALGLSRHRLIGLLSAEAALAGMVAALVALGLSTGLLALGSGLLDRSVGHLVSAPPRLILPSWLILSVLVLTPLINALAVWVPAGRTVGGSIAATLRR